jgi:hypothetical protein
MRKSIFTLTVLLLLLVVVSSAFAASGSYHVDIDGSEPMISYCDPSDPQSFAHYDTFTYKAQVTAAHTIEMSNSTSAVSYVLVYVKGTYDPACWNSTYLGLAYHGDAIVNMTQGTTYMFVAGIDHDGTGKFDFSVTPDGVVPDAKPAAADSDNDDDGIPNDRDNCPNAANAGQEDGWGNGAGDACDTDWYNMIGIGIAGFTQKNGEYHLHGNCSYMEDGAPRCPEIAVFDPATFTPEQMPVEVTTGAAGDMSVWIYYLHSNNGADVYQVNVYSTNPPQPDSLLDDRLEFHVSGGAWQWYQRGGDAESGGLPAVNASANGTSFGG